MPKYDLHSDVSLTLNELTMATFPGGPETDLAPWRNRLRVLGIRGAFGLVSGGGKSGRHRRYDSLSIVIAKAVCTLIDGYKVHSDIAVEIGQHIHAHRDELNCGDPVLILGDWDQEDSVINANNFQICCRDDMLVQLTARRFRHVLILQLEEPEGESDLI